MSPVVYVKRMYSLSIACVYNCLYEYEVSIYVYVTTFLVIKNRIFIWLTTKLHTIYNQLLYILNQLFNENTNKVCQSFA